jgi:hypothetical protein
MGFAHFQRIAGLKKRPDGKLWVSPLFCRAASWPKPEVAADAVFLGIESCAVRAIDECESRCRNRDSDLSQNRMNGTVSRVCLPGLRSPKEGFCSELTPNRTAPVRRRMPFLPVVFPTENSGMAQNSPNLHCQPRGIGPMTSVRSLAGSNGGCQFRWTKKKHVTKVTCFEN